MRWLALIAALSCAACGADDAPEPSDATPDAVVDAMDGGTLDGSVTTRYTGDRPPQDGFCDASGDATLIESFPQALTLDSRRLTVDRARASILCSIATTAIAPDFVYTFTPDESGLFTMRTRALDPSAFVDTVVYVRDACDGTGVELGCNDDAEIDLRTSRLAVELAAGVQVYAIVDGFAANDVGEIELSMDFVPVPEPTMGGGETCETATELVFSGDGDTRIAMATGDTTDAASDSGCAEVPTTNGMRDLFHAFTIDETRDVAIRITPETMWDAALYVRSDCAELDTVVCSDTRPPGGEESVLLPALPPGRYVIGVDAYAQPRMTDWEQGPYVLDVTATRP